MPVLGKRFTCQPGKNQEAVAVAADALWQLRTGRVATGHCYVAAGSGGSLYRDKFRSRKKQVCRACAIGALMLAQLRRFDKGWVKGLNPAELIAHDYQDTIRRQMASIFPKSTLAIIEAVYEHTSPAFNVPLFEQFIQTACNANELSMLHGGRDDLVMAAIFRNIIANKGNFKPETGVHSEISVKIGKSGKVVVVRKPARKRRTSKLVAGGDQRGNS